MLQNEIKEFELVIENQEKTIAEQQVADDWPQSYLLSIFLLQNTFLMARYPLVTDLMDLSQSVYWNFFQLHGGTRNGKKESRKEESDQEEGN